ncbi:DNA-binding transcriptional regulator, AcrR family [Paenibacillus catalpae]|uniref:DNA-binding transcriptional regulator, AcrR family n=1 Tax=Paenibacillus catalpae TaxID=1045775 RepID=A0A1I1Y361_9BACL|nr:TetR/AcrR family transcriptional regulator [Paenibacillus catalpae]SFE14145.1 DNA-binding transcriptional regulator, AcrR family [Paenibacillus catalpae]
MSPRIGLDLQTIIQKAAMLADENGLESVTLASLSQELGVRSPSLYNHVEGLSGLKEKLALHGLKSLHDKLLRAAAGRSGDDAVFAIGLAYIRFAREHPGLYEATLPAQHTENEELLKISEELIQLIIQVMHHAYEMKQEDTIHLVRGFRSFMHGFATLERSGGFGLPVNLDESIQFVLRTYLTGIRENFRS